MISRQAELIEGILRLVHFKSIIKWLATHPTRNKGQFVPQKISKTFSVKLQTVDSRAVATIERKVTASKTHIIYLHGGGFVFEISDLHWNLIKKILQKVDCRISVVDYPLVPESSHIDVFAMLAKTYQTIIQQYPEDKIVLMGDSAGAGLALAFAQNLLQNKALNLPEKLILISPWLDLSLANPDLEICEKMDVQLSKDFLQYCADKYASGVDKSDYLLSPINGVLQGLPKTIVYYGSRELLVADIDKWRLHAEREHAQVEFHKYEGMQHDWVILPIPEAERAILEICESLY